MTEKPKIQYVGQFYIHGSEAPKLEPLKPQRTAKTRLPLERLRKIEKIYLDPVATVAIVVSIVLLVTMFIGYQQIQNDWAQYRAAAKIVNDLNEENTRLELAYYASYNIDEIQLKAEALGLVPVEDVPVRSVTVTIPEPEPEIDPFDAWLAEVKWFWNGLWA